MSSILGFGQKPAKLSLKTNSQYGKLSRTALADDFVILVPLKAKIKRFAHPWEKTVSGFACSV